MSAERPSVGEGAVESLDFAVRLRTVWSSSFRPDPELGVGIPPGVRPIRGAIVGEHPLDSDATRRES